ncbi:MAG: formate dehydrogenase accessory sulfurtransferase FdhD [Chloroflexi bacterium]|nr:formate dehydrogenase accessory sulfurtransferase FdhD [Chloroflexota bacterium]
MQPAADPLGASSDMTVAVFDHGHWTEVERKLVLEKPLSIYVDQKEWVTILCTPSKLNCLVVGFLYFEGLITSLADVALIRVCDEDETVDVRLAVPLPELPTRRVLTTGCGGGVAFAIDSLGLPKVQSDLVVAPSHVQSLMKKLHERATLYRQCGGVHTSALCDPEDILVAAEDVGRHNTLDKIQGACMLLDVPTRDRILLTTGRLSSEMLVKAARMQVPIVVSRSAATDRATRLADQLGITLVGYARGERMLVYSHSYRLMAVS